MSEDDHNWKIVTLPFDKDMHDALQQQHHAAQFIALAGRHLIPQQSDDSNTNMRFLSENNMLVGNALANGTRLGLQLTNLDIYLLNNKFDEISKITLVGKTRQHAFQELKKLLAESGIDSSKLSQELHYEIPNHPVGDGIKFYIKDKNFLMENAIYRHNSEIVLGAICSSFKDAAPVRIWPHHFDTGTMIPLSYNTKGRISKSLGLGWAIPDSMLDEPYYYLSYWSEDANENIKDLPLLDAGKWMMPEWNGAVLRHSEIMQNHSAQGQFELVNSFFRSGVNIQNYIN
jgi:hypothetical protein